MREDRSLQRVTQNAIDTFDQKRDVDSSSIATTVIRKKINEAAYKKINPSNGKNDTLTYA